MTSKTFRFHRFRSEYRASCTSNCISRTQRIVVGIRRSFFLSVPQSLSLSLPLIHSCMQPTASSAHNRARSHRCSLARSLAGHPPCRLCRTHSARTVQPVNRLAQISVFVCSTIQNTHIHVTRTHTHHTKASLLCSSHSFASDSCASSLRVYGHILVRHFFRFVFSRRRRDSRVFSKIHNTHTYAHTII